MEFVRELIPMSLNDHRKILILAVLFESLLCAGFSISAFVVAQAANAGFDVVLTSLVTMVFLGGSFHLIRQSTSPIAIGFLVGSSGMLAVLSLITGIYWSKLSHCEHYDNAEIAQYSCGNTAAYTSVSFFSIMLFIMELLCACLVFSWRTDLIDEVGRYDEISESTGGISNLPTFNPYSNSPKVYGGEVYGRIEERSAEL